MTSPPARVAVLTIVAGRHDHLRGQVAGLARSHRPPDLHVVVSMGDDDITAGRVEGLAGAWPTEIVPVEVDDLGLPLARARNAAAARAEELGADLLVFLDVDCIPGPDLLGTYATHALGPQRPPSPAIWCGDVAYLPPLGPGEELDLDRLAERGRHRDDRVLLGPGETQREEDLRMFWSLSFAMTPQDFREAGGFCEDYVGYGGEDTDFAQSVEAAGGSLTWVGGATAYHQHHESTSPPVQHLEAVVRNAGVFHDRWGWWPMEGWLAAFEERGLARVGAGGRWEVAR